MKILEQGVVARGGEAYSTGNGMFSYHGWPTVCKADDGALLVVCSGMRLAHVCPFGRTVLYKSRDEGKTWSPPAVINDTFMDNRDAGILNAGGNRVVLSWFDLNARFYTDEHRDSVLRHASPYEAGFITAQLTFYASLSEEQKKGGSYIRVSDDGGETWGGIRPVPVSSPHGPALLSNGSLLYLGKELADGDNMHEGPIAAYVSRNGGELWEKRGEITPPKPVENKHFHEPHAVELPSGRILGAIRSEGTEDKGTRFNIFTTYSDDGGKTWSRPRLLPADGSPPHLLLHSSGAVICTFGRRRDPFGERAVVSADGGATWSSELSLFEGAPGGDLGYPSTVELSDGSLFTVYYQQYEAGEKTSLMFTRWEL